MLTDMIAEEEFEIKEEEPWYDPQDLEHDLHLAAELGKTLLERNHELEQALQQMYVANQEQQQEIEYLSKQVDLLRSVNDQHAKVYEQLDTTARDLEQSNQRLVLDNRSAQLKIEGLTETINGLQCQVEDLQREVKELKTVPSEQTTPDLLEPQWPASSPTPPCLKEQYQSHKCPPFEHSVSASTPSIEQEDWEEEHSALLHSVETLQAQLKAERALREAAEQDTDALAREISELEPRVTLIEGYKARLAELEAEVEELRQLWRSDSASGGAGHTHRLLLPDTVFFPSEEDMSEAWQRSHMLKRCNSERQLRGVSGEDSGLRDMGRVNVCRGHSETAKYHQGISLLNEVDAEYSALQRKYNALLRRCEDGPQPRSHKAVQTATVTQHLTPSPAKHPCSQGVGTQDDVPLPEYKVLFHEIFACIQRSKENLRENRAKSSLNTAMHYDACTLQAS
ncbi:cerebellar degeneration-related protein 2 [Colossoma macropomum]|uniref:cerebellar degeneration-related protein 2 n=1 Tax=Colossoma macropomum TaxID=42526 RepID=UPI001863A4BB|nr:cerebellar degeneration-related protein 2 [Colossoma macropomum]XP_036428781.1 cerebellar degeneration-related protein 2 [Colossoma macropomum]